MSRLNRLVLEGHKTIGLSFKSTVGWELEDERGASAYQMDTYVPISSCCVSMLYLVFIRQVYFQRHQGVQGFSGVFR